MTWVSRSRLSAASLALLLALTGAVALAPAADAAITPIAHLDFYAGDLGETISIAVPGILANDFGVGSDYEAKFVFTDVPDLFDVHSDGSFTFTPGDASEGEYDFKYCIVSKSGGDRVSNTVDVKLFNGQPFVPAHSYATPAGQELVVPAPGLMAGAQNVDDDYIEITGDAKHGALTLNPDRSGAFTYLPAPGFIGTDTFGAPW